MWNEPGQIFGRIEAVGVDHEVPVGEIDLRSFAPVLPVEELRQGSLLDRVDRVVVKPRTEIKIFKIKNLFVVDWTGCPRKVFNWKVIVLVYLDHIQNLQLAIMKSLLEKTSFLKHKHKNRYKNKWTEKHKDKRQKNEPVWWDNDVVGLLGDVVVGVLLVGRVVHSGPGNVAAVLVAVANVGLVHVHVRRCSLEVRMFKDWFLFLIKFTFAFNYWSFK